MRYEPNPKHKYPWQPGKKGSLCPWFSESEIHNLLAGSIYNCGYVDPAGRKRLHVLADRKIEA